MRTPLVLAAAALALALVGCTKPVTALPVPPSPTETPAFASDQEALDAAFATYGRAVEAGVVAGKDGWADDPDVYKYFSGDALVVAQQAFADARAQNLTASGDEGLDSPQLQQVTESAGVYRITFYVCLDRTSWRIVEEDGTPRAWPETRLPMVVTAEGSAPEMLTIVEADRWDGSSFC